ncbi:hypothetical protein, partial [Streptomyces sp. NPDC001139]
WTYPDTPPLSVYNTVVNAGPFHEIRREADGHAEYSLRSFRASPRELPASGRELWNLASGHSITCVPPERKAANALVLFCGWVVGD